MNSLERTRWHNFRIIKNHNVAFERDITIGEDTMNKIKWTKTHNTGLKEVRTQHAGMFISRITCGSGTKLYYVEDRGYTSRKFYSLAVAKRHAEYRQSEANTPKPPELEIIQGNPFAPTNPIGQLKLVS